MSRPPLKLYWWTERMNFGDAIAPHLVALASGREVVWAAPEACDLFAVGSVMSAARRARGPERKAAGKPWIWGSGCLGPMQRDFLGRLRIASLRGPLSAEILGLDPRMLLGDPAVLLPRIVPPVPPEERRGIGIVPHFSKVGYYRSLHLAGHPEVRIIDVTRDDPLDVVRQIAACRAVYSSSLHGLIVADAFRVPNHWLDPEGNHSISRFKFYDYAASVGRGLSEPLAPSQIDLTEAAFATEAFPWWPAVDRLAESVARAFPNELRA